MQKTTLDPTGRVADYQRQKTVKGQRGVFDGPAIKIDSHQITADLKPLKPKLRNLMTAEAISYQGFQERFFTRSDDGALVANSPQDCKDDPRKATLFSNNWKLRENTMTELFSNPEIVRHGKEWLSLLNAFVNKESEAQNLIWDSSHSIESQPANIEISTSIEPLIDKLDQKNGNVNLAPLVKSFLLKNRELSSTEKLFILQKFMLKHLYTDETMNTLKTGANIKAFTKLVNQLTTPLFSVSEVLVDDKHATKLFDGYFRRYFGFDLDSARNAIKFTPYERSGDDLTIAKALVDYAQAVNKKGEHENALRLYGYAYKLLTQRGLKEKNSELAAEVKEAAMKTALKASSKKSYFTKNINTTEEPESSNNFSIQIELKNPLEQANELVADEILSIAREIPAATTERRAYFEDKIARLYGWDGEGSIDEFYNTAQDYICPQERPKNTPGTILNPPGMRDCTIQKVKDILLAEEQIQEDHRDKPEVLKQALKELSWVYHIDQFYTEGEMSNQIKELMNDVALSILAA